MNVKILTALLAAAMLTTTGAVTASAGEAAGAVDMTDTVSSAEIIDTAEDSSTDDKADSEESSSDDSSSVGGIESYFVYDTESGDDSAEGSDSSSDISEDSSSETENRYYTDDYYQTDGNATLIKKEKVIYESEEMQFIAVTTKDGSVFYILINYSAAGDEDNVYFLNRVDDYDLYALLYASDEENEDGESVDTAQAAKQAADKANGVSDSESDTDTEGSDETENKPAAQQGGFGANTSMLLILGVVALGGVGFALFKLTGKKKDTKPEVDFDEDVDDFDISDDAEM